MALIANCHRAEQTRAFHPHDFHPFRARPRDGTTLTADNLHLLAGAFVNKRDDEVIFERD